MATTTTGRPALRPWWHLTRRFAHRLARGSIRVVAWTALLAASSIVAAVLAGGDHDLAVVLLAALDGWVLPAVAVATLGIGVLRLLRATVRRLIVATSAVLLVALVVLQPWPHGGAATGSGDAGAGSVPLRVMALNLQFGGADPGQVLAQVTARKPDVLVLTELTPEAATALRAQGLETLLPYAQVRARAQAGGTGVWSRLPLTGAAAIPGTRFEAVQARISVGGSTLTVFGVHPSPPTALAEWIADYRVLGSEVDRQSRGGSLTVVAGDLNAGVHNGPLARLLATGESSGTTGTSGTSDGLRDAATATGWPWQGQTWPTDLGIPRVIRIDHVLASPSIGIDGIDTFAVDGTDHRGVFAVLRVPAP